MARRWLAKLDREGFAVASGAACSSANPEPSHVLRAMGVAPEIARGAVRVSLGAANTEAEIEQFINALQATVGRLQGLTAMPFEQPDLARMTMKLPIYLDYSATTPVDPRVAEKMIPYLCEHFGNPASRSHSFGWVADAAVEEAREQVAALVNADPKEIVWTSGATESNNLAIKGAANFYAGTKGKHIITVKTEHKAVLDTVRELERQGFEATYLDVKENGLLDLDVFKAAIRPDTVLVSVMYVNNEVGVVQPIAESVKSAARKASSSTSMRRRPPARSIST
jgi:cysteine sulfinate desulfinase/cysteine desulfurase-like protein